MRRRDRAHRGEMTRLIFGELRQASEPLTTRDIAVQARSKKKSAQGKEKGAPPAQAPYDPGKANQKKQGRVLFEDLNA